MSPEGQTVVYSAVGDGGSVRLFRRPTDQFKAVPMVDIEGGRDPLFSPDGQWVSFFSSADRTLRKVSLAGGPSQKLTELPNVPGLRGGSWSTDDMLLLGRAQDLVRVPTASGEPIVLVEAQAGFWPWYPQVLPNTGVILFTFSELGPDRRELLILWSESGERLSGLSNAVADRILDTGHLVFDRGGVLWAAPFDRDRLEIVGNPVPVVAGVRVFRGDEVQYAVAGYACVTLKSG